MVYGQFQELPDMEDPKPEPTRECSMCFNVCGPDSPAPVTGGPDYCSDQCKRQDEQTAEAIRRDLNALDRLEQKGGAA
jgi:hypothetical protein